MFNFNIEETIISNNVNDISILSEDVIDNSNNFKSRKNFDFYYDFALWLTTIFDNIKNNCNSILLQHILINAELFIKGQNSKNQKIKRTFSNGHIAGLLIQDAIIQLLSAHVKTLNDKSIAIITGKDNLQINDFQIKYKECPELFNIQVKSILSKYAKSGKIMNNAIRNGNNIGLVIIYEFNKDKTIISLKELQIYLPEEIVDKSGNITYQFNHIAQEYLKNKRLKLNIDKSFMTIN